MCAFALLTSFSFVTWWLSVPHTIGFRGFPAKFEIYVAEPLSIRNITLILYCYRSFLLYIGIPSNKAIFATFLYDARNMHYFQGLLIWTVHTNRSSLLLVIPHPSVISSCLKLWDMNFLSSVHKIKTQWAHCSLWRFMSVFLHFITHIITWCEHGNIYTKTFMLSLQMNLITKD